MADDDDTETGSARYVFRVDFRIEPHNRDVTLDPDRFQTTLYREADQPGEDGWLFFRDNLWRGDVNDVDHFRELTEEALEVPVSSVSFAELQTDEVYLADLKAAVADRLEEFGENSVDQALTKYLGSSIHVKEVE